jgi:hypothetical protein
MVANVEHYTVSIQAGDYFFLGLGAELTGAPAGEFD